MHSLEFRKAALKYYHKAHSYMKTCEAFEISQSTLHEWIKREGTGCLESRCHGTSPKIDREKLREYVDEHPDAYQREIAEVFGCSQPTICYNLKVLGYTLKKRPAGMPNRIL